MSSDFERLVDKLAHGRCEVRSDSRQVGPGDIFIAVPGDSVDGIQFVPDAILAGATAIVCPEHSACEAAGILAASGREGRCVIVPHRDTRHALGVLAEARWGTGRLPLDVIGITGTNGKTTTSYLLEHLFRSLGEKTGVIGTVSYRWPGHEEAATLTTPDVLQIHSMLSRMAKNGVRKVVMEVSSHAIAQQRISGIPFAGAAFTNLTQDHLDFHHDMESYFQVKASLFTTIPAMDKKMAINSDDPWGRRLLEMTDGALAFGIYGHCRDDSHLSCELLSAGISGCHMRMRHCGRTWELRSPLVGEFNAHNLLTAQAIALQLGYGPEDLSQLGGFGGVCGRLERIGNPAGLHVFVDYAHTPDALVNVLTALRKAGFQSIVAVFGCGGNRDRTKRPLMGRAVARYADIAILTSDNPRFENAQDIINDVLPGLEGAQKVFVEADRRKATELAIGMLGPDDALLVAGKGHEDYQIVNGVKRHYSDQETVREILHCA